MTLKILVILVTLEILVILVTLEILVKLVTLEILVKLEILVILETLAEILVILEILAEILETLMTLPWRKSRSQGVGRFQMSLDHGQTCVITMCMLPKDVISKGPDKNTYIFANSTIPIYAHKHRPHWTSSRKCLRIQPYFRDH